MREVSRWMNLKISSDEVKEERVAIFFDCLDFFCLSQFCCCLFVCLLLCVVCLLVALLYIYGEWVRVCVCERTRTQVNNSSLYRLCNLWASRKCLHNERRNHLSAMNFRDLINLMCWLIFVYNTIHIITENWQYINQFPDMVLVIQFRTFMSSFYCIVFSKRWILLLFLLSLPVVVQWYIVP